MCGALVVLRAELLLPVRGWRGSGGDALGTGGLCGQGSLLSKPFSLGGFPWLQDGVGEGQDRARSWCKSGVCLLFPWQMQSRLSSAVEPKGLDPAGV